MINIFSSERNDHRPPHLYLDGEIYFVTCRTVNKVNYFVGKKKMILKNCLMRVVKKYQAEIYSWVILNNHYHLLLGFPIDESFWCDGLRPRCDGLRPEAEIRYADHCNEFPPPRRGQFVRPNRSPLAKFIQYINRDSARIINKLDNCRGRNIWYQYWDRIIRNEKDFYIHFNYIHYNPIKHGLVGNCKKLLDYKFCSYNSWYKKLGASSMKEIIGGYPLSADYNRWDI
jgi:REP element-mobilizing transposase RayT